MSSGPALDAGIGFAVRVPPNWFELDVHPATRDASVRELVRTRVAAVPELQARRSEITKLLREQAASAWDAGAVFCAGMAEPVLDGVLPASLTVFMLPGPLGARSDEPDRVSALLPMLQPKEAKHPDDTWTKVEILELEGCGPAVRTYGVEDVEPEPGRGIRVAQMQTFVPVPHVNRVVLVSCSSPAVAVAEGLFDLFDAVTGTLRLFEDDTASRRAAQAVLAARVAAPAGTAGFTGTAG